MVPEPFQLKLKQEGRVQFRSLNAEAECCWGWFSGPQPPAPGVWHSARLFSSSRSHWEPACPACRARTLWQTGTDTNLWAREWRPSSPSAAAISYFRHLPLAFYLQVSRSDLVPFSWVKSPLTAPLSLMFNLYLNGEGQLFFLRNSNHNPLKIS